MTFTFDLFGTIALVVIGLLGFLSARTLNKIDKNQDLMFEKINRLGDRMTRLETEHNSRTVECQRMIDKFDHAIHTGNYDLSGDG